MNDFWWTSDMPWIGRHIRYYGKNRPHLNDTTFVVEQENSRSVAFYHNGKLEWCSKDSVCVIDNNIDRQFSPCVTDNKLDQEFTSASGGTVANLEAEIRRVRARLADLEKALSVIRSL